MNKKITTPVVHGVFGLVIQKYSYDKIGQMLLLDSSTVRSIAEGKKYKETRKGYPRLKELKKEIRRRNSYYHDLVSLYKIKKIEKLWLSGKGRAKIIEETGYGYDLVKKVISKLVIKHGRKRADAKKR